MNTENNNYYWKRKMPIEHTKLIYHPLFGCSFLAWTYSSAHVMSRKSSQHIWPTYWQQSTCQCCRYSKCTVIYLKLFHSCLFKQLGWLRSFIWNIAVHFSCVKASGEYHGKFVCCPATSGPPVWLNILLK